MARRGGRLAKSPTILTHWDRGWLTGVATGSGKYSLCIHDFAVETMCIPIRRHGLGKMRLSRENYFATQTIYYPGFTIGGFAEPAGAIATLVLTLLTPRDNAAFVWTLASCLALAAVHVVYWTVTHPVNQVWMSSVSSGGAARRFFSSGTIASDDHWEQLRDRWERSHVIRAALAVIGFISLAIGVVLRNGS